MGYRNLQECVKDLERNGHLRRIEREVDPELEIGVIQRKVFQAQGPALLFTRVKGCGFPMLGNLFGTLERMHFLFRDALDFLRKMAEIRNAPGAFFREPFRNAAHALRIAHMVPRKVRTGPVTANRTTVARLPHLKSWPDDGGAFITLPQVYTESIERPGWRRSNLGMYRVQLSGGCYRENEEVGIHYQLHRGIGIHHAEAIRHRVPLRANVFVGGPPALTVAAVMPLPQGCPELAFAGLLGGRRLEMVHVPGSLPFPAEADFCITGHILPDRLLPEGPFGDHLGYYSLRHDFPVLRVENVFHREGAIWPFTTVGRPPQEDSVFGAFIHEITGPLIPDVLPGVKAVHAVDAAGVHPLLLAVGQERYTPYSPVGRPQELLTLANAILGHGQLSLAKYLLIAAQEDDPKLDAQDVRGFFLHVLERVDWRRDLHFHTCTTIDTLDYSGSGFNEGSKVVIASAGTPVRKLPTEIPAALRLPPGFGEPRVCLPGILSVKGPPCTEKKGGVAPEMEAFCAYFGNSDPIAAFPMVVVVDDSEFAARHLNNFLWITFTRSDPATDIYGVGAAVRNKHWGCTGPLVIDARMKPHHAPPLVEDAAVEKRVNALGARGGPLHGII